MEFEHVKKVRAILNNRMYCDYYKLHNIIIKFCKEHIPEETLNVQTFPVYKDLEPYQEYRIEDISLLHESILNLINTLYNETQSKTDTILHYNDNHKVGFSISNFLNTLTHENRILQEQITLYINYISFFHISQKKQLKKLHIRIQDFYKEVDENINMNYTFSIDDISNDDSFDLINEGDNLSTTELAAMADAINSKEKPVVVINQNDDNKAEITDKVVTLPSFKSLSDTVN